MDVLRCLSVNGNMAALNAERRIKDKNTVNRVIGDSIDITEIYRNDILDKQLSNIARIEVPDAKRPPPDIWSNQLWSTDDVSFDSWVCTLVHSLIVWFRDSGWGDPLYVGAHVHSGGKNGPSNMQYAKGSRFTENSNNNNNNSSFITSFLPLCAVHCDIAARLFPLVISEIIHQCGVNSLVSQCIADRIATHMLNEGFSTMRSLNQQNQYQTTVLTQY